MSQDASLLGTFEHGVPCVAAGTAVTLLPEAALARLAALVDMALGLDGLDSGARAPNGSGVRVAICAMSESTFAAPVICRDVRGPQVPASPPTGVLPSDARAFVLLPMTDEQGVVLDAAHAGPQHLVLSVSSRMPASWTNAQITRLATVAAASGAEIRARAELGVAERIAEGLRRYSFRDPVTELANRELLIDRLGQAILRASRQPTQPFAVFSVALDQFADIEATLGYDAADDVLATVARRLETVVRGFDTVARLGGDDFILLVESIADHGEAATIAGRVRDVLLDPIQTRWGDTVIVSASMGIVLSSSGVDSPTRLIQLAGMARSRARATGSAFEYFDPAMQEQARRRLRHETDLRRGVEANEFELHYQPIVCLNTGRVTQVEALIRWRHPERGLLTASEFIPLAEETGIIVPLGWWVLAQACPQLEEWRRRFPAGRGLTMSVNIGAVHLAQRDVISRVETVLSASGLPPNCINLEITEGALIADPERARLTLQGLGELGIGIYLDDFGSGYSSLRYLHELPLDVIKIDRAFIAQMAHGTRHVQLVATIRELAHQIGTRVVAEGIETADQLELVRSLRCEYAQGFFLGRPMPADQIESRLSGGAPLTSVNLGDPVPAWSAPV